MIAGSVISAMPRNVPSHKGRPVTSNSNARLGRCAQVRCLGREGSGEPGGFVWPDESGLWPRALRGLAYGVWYYVVRH